MAEVIGEVEPVKKVMAIADKKYSNRKSLEDEEKELEELIQQQSDETEAVERQAQEEAEEREEPENAEEKTFKKRYGDLRRHTQKQQKDFDDKISVLQKQLDEATKSQIQLPKSEEELEEWSKEYPDVAAVIETIAIKKSREQSQEIETRLAEIDDLQNSAKKEKAEAQLLSLHPDFEDIRSSDDFHDWADEQPKWVQDALYENETDARSAARAIDLYKVDRGIERTEKKTKPKSNKSAASLVDSNSPKTLPDTEGNSKKWKESTVEAMSSAEYEKNADVIMDSIRSGNFIYDVTGNAR
jgi:DNA repair exonuclease SbcCD ATPase subunit|tara:strand:+ start:4210 stop:5106 length:897 start_codon:yes stop_codon:yes gene_type:complete